MVMSSFATEAAAQQIIASVQVQLMANYCMVLEVRIFLNIFKELERRGSKGGEGGGRISPTRSTTVPHEPEALCDAQHLEYLLLGSLQKGLPTPNLASVIF